MRYQTLGRSGMRVSSLCLGTMTFGRETPATLAHEMIAMSEERGVNFIDTANIYGDGTSERIVGEGLVGRRDRWIVATKACQPIGEKGPNDRGASRRHLRRQVEDSLKRLQTDWIDLFYVHLFDADTSLEETMSVLDDLVREGKIMAIGVSNFSAWQTMKAQGIAGARGGALIHALQPMYSLLKRQVEVEILPMAQSEGMSVVPYSPLGAGLLTGKYNTSEAGPEEGRLKTNAMYQRRYHPPEYLSISASFSALAAEEGVHPASLAIAWVGSHPGVTSPIIGARDLAQLAPCLQAAELLDDGLDRRLYERIADLSPTPAPATDRLEIQMS